MRLTKKEKEFLFEVLDRLTNAGHYCEIDESDYHNLAKPLFKKLRLELKGY